MTAPLFTLPVLADKFGALSIEGKKRHGLESHLVLTGSGLVAWDGVSEEEGAPQHLSISADEARRLARALLYAADLMDVPGGDLSPTIGGR